MSPVCVARMYLLSSRRLRLSPWAVLRVSRSKRPTYSFIATLRRVAGSVVAILMPSGVRRLGSVTCAANVGVEAVERGLAMEP